MKLPFLFPVFILTFPTIPLHAEIMVAPTLEWMADHCIDSGIYVVTAAPKKKNSGIYLLTLTLKRSLRGKPKRLILEPYSEQPSRKMPTKLSVKKGHEFLVCIQHYETGGRRVMQLINLSQPQTTGVHQIAVTSDLKLLKDRKTILSVFEGRIKTHPRSDPVKVGDFSKDNRLELDSESEVYRAIYSGSSCYLRIPSDLVKKK